MKKLKRIFFIYMAIMIIGVFVLSYSLTTIATYLYNYNHYAHVNGTIIGYTLGDAAEKNMIISYSVEGEEYKIYSSFSEADTYPVGYQIVVRYNANHPERYILGNERINIGAVVIGTACSVFGLLGMINVYMGDDKKKTKGEK